MCAFLFFCPSPYDFEQEGNLYGTTTPYYLASNQVGWLVVSFIIPFIPISNFVRDFIFVVYCCCGCGCCCLCVFHRTLRTYCVMLLKRKLYVNKKKQPRRRRLLLLLFERRKPMKWKKQYNRSIDSNLCKGKGVCIHHRSQINETVLVLITVQNCCPFE